MSTKAPPKKHGITKRLLSLLLMLTVLVTNISIPQDIFAASKDVTHLLKGPDNSQTPKVTVTVGSKKIAENSNETINPTDQITMRVDFKVPLYDNKARINNKDEKNYVKKGDTAKIDINIKGLQLKEDKTISIDAYDGDKKIGKLATAKFTKNSSDKMVLDMTFDGDDEVLEKGKYTSASGYAQASFSLADAATPGDENKENYIEILGKKYQFKKKEIEHKAIFEKKGQVLYDNADERAILWTLTADTKEGNLKGYTLEDDLTNVGAYINGSFELKDSNKVSKKITPTLSGQKLSYKFTEDIKTPATITFKTKLESDKFYSIDSEKDKQKKEDMETIYKENTITNTATLKKDQEIKAKEDVRWNNKWAIKEFENYKYNETDKSHDVSWKITVNYDKKAHIKNLKIKDILFEDLKNSDEYILDYKSAQLKVYDKDDKEITSREKTYNKSEITSSKGKRTIGTTQFNTKNWELYVGEVHGKVELIVNASIKRKDAKEFDKKDFRKTNRTIINHAEITFDNTTTIRVINVRDIKAIGITKGLDYPDGVYSIFNLTGYSEVPIVNFDTVWRIMVDNDSINENTTVYDMLIFDNTVTKKHIEDKELTVGKNGPKNINGVELSSVIPEGTFLKHHKYIGVDNKTDNNIKVESKEIYHGDKYVGDLLVITGFEKDKRTVYIKTSLRDYEAIINKTDSPYNRKNDGHHIVKNTAYLKESPESDLKRITHWPGYISRMLEKEALSIEDATGFKEAVKTNNSDNIKNYANQKDPDIAKDNKEIFNNKDKTIMYRLSVNANGIHDVGNLVVQDTLPYGFILKSYTILEGESEQKSDTKKITTDEAYKAKLSARVLVKDKFNIVSTGTGESDNDIVKVDCTGKEGDLNIVKFTFKNIDKPYVIMLEAQYDKDGFDTDKYPKDQYENIKIRNISKTYLEADSNNSSNIIQREKEVQLNLKNDDIIFKGSDIAKDDIAIQWYIDYRVNNLVYNKATIEDTLPDGIDIRTISDASGGKKIDLTNQDNFKIYEVKLKNNKQIDETSIIDSNKISDISKYISYDEKQRKLTFTIPDVSKSYRFYYMTDISKTDKNLKNTAVLKSGTSTITPETSSTFYVDDAKGQAFLEKAKQIKPSIEILKTDEKDNPLKAAEFTLTKKGDPTHNITKKSDDQGKALFKDIDDGEYELKETKAPDGYKKDDTVYKVEVKKNEYNIGIAIISKEVSGKQEEMASGNKSNIKIVNKKIAPKPQIKKSDLEISKQVTGAESIDSNKEFNFTIKLEKDGEALKGQYDCEKDGKKEKITLTDGKYTFTLKHNQKILIKDIEEDVKYTVTEDDYTGESYKLSARTKDGKSYTQNTPDEKSVIGEIKADKTSKIEFTNEKIAPNPPTNSVETTSSSILIAKKVVDTKGNEISDDNKLFKFTLNLYDKDGNALYKSYDYYEVDDSFNQIGQNKQITNQGSFELKHGQKIHIVGLEENTRFTITEDDYSSDNYTLNKIEHTSTSDAQLKNESSKLTAIEAVTIKSTTSSIIFVNLYDKPSSPPSSPSDDEETNNGGGGGGGNTPPKSEEKPKQEKPPVPEEPKQEQPNDPPVPPTQPPQLPLTPPATPQGPPRYTQNNIPDPKDPDSPDEIVLVDEDGVPLGTYIKQTNPDGTVEYVLVDEDVPLGATLPTTGDTTSTVYYLIGLALIITALKKRR